MTVIYCFNEPIYDGHTIVGNKVVEMTEQEVLDYYWVYWKIKMELKYGVDHPLTCKQNCVDDFVACYWAWTREVPDPVQS